VIYGTLSECSSRAKSTSMGTGCFLMWLRWTRVIALCYFRMEKA
jgi:hypothetical protein